MARDGGVPGPADRVAVEDAGEEGRQGPGRDDGPDQVQDLVELLAGEDAVVLRQDRVLDERYPPDVEAHVEQVILEGALVSSSSSSLSLSIIVDVALSGAYDDDEVGKKTDYRKRSYIGDKQHVSSLTIPCTETERYNVQQVHKLRRYLDVRRYCGNIIFIYLGGAAKNVRSQRRGNSHLSLDRNRPYGAR